MRAHVKDGIGIFTPQGFLDGNNASAFISLDDIEATINLKIDMLPKDISISEGDLVATSGLEPDIPAGLIIGQVSNTLGFSQLEKREFNFSFTN